MKKIIALLIIFVLFAVGCSTGKVPQSTPDVNKPSEQNNNNNDNREPVLTDDEDSIDEQDNQTSNKVTKVKMFLIAIDDKGQSGKEIGAGDSVVPVEVEIEPTRAPLSAAYNKLLSNKDKDYGESGFYNPLYKSNLKLERAAIKDGTAEVHLSGSLVLGGALDNPRVKAQLEETALQFNTVKKVIIYINDKTLDEALSLKG